MLSSALKKGKTYRIEKKVWTFVGQDTGNPSLVFVSALGLTLLNQGVSPEKLPPDTIKRIGHTELIQVDPVKQ